MNIPKLVQEAKLPKGEYIVVASGILNALGIRNSDDIDLVVSPELYSNLKKAGWQEIDKGGYFVIQKGVFEAFTDWDSSDKTPNLKELLQDSKTINSVPFASLQRVKSWKAKMRRPKDLKDIQLIDNYLKTKNIA